jgi:hypothetical protein
VRITQVAGSSGTRKKGDVVIEILKTTAENLSDFLNVIGLAQARAECKSDGKRRRIIRSHTKRALTSLKIGCAELIRQLASYTLEEVQNGALQALNPVNLDNPVNPATHPEGASVLNILLGQTLVTIGVFREYIAEYTGLPLEKLFANAAAVTEIVGNYVSFDPTNQTNIAMFNMENENSLKKKVQDTDCKQDIVCLEDNC